jgi:hypothetical protein
MPSTFTMPSTREGPAGFDKLFYRYKLDRTDSLIIKNGVPTQKRTFEVSELTSADYYYVGGHIYNLSPTEVTVLTNAGYGAYITTF